MKKTLLVALPFLALSALTAQLAQAAATTDLTLSGKIVPTSCDISLANGGNFSYGDRAAKDLHPTSYTQLETLESSLAITCSGPMQIGMKSVDNVFNTHVTRDATNLYLADYTGSLQSQDARFFGLGLSKDGKKIGAYLLESKAGSAIADGQAAGFLQRYGDAGPWYSLDTMTFWADRNLPYVHSISAVGSAVPIPVTNVTFTLGVHAGIGINQGLTFDDVVNLQGNSTLELTYL
jgi:type 1 fimbria pilin